MVIKDSNIEHWVYKYLPEKIVPYAQLARWDRPVGWKLLVLPCWISSLLAFASPIGPQVSVAKLVYYGVLFLLGAMIMRAAACTFNDIVDINIDKQVDRTKERPLASGRISKFAAIVFLIAQCFVAFILLLQFNKLVVITGFCSLFFAIIYPFMKRVTYWPQFFLGLAFNWGAIIAWEALKCRIDMSVLFLTFGMVFWTMGYDTIYAYQDVEDDIKVGIGSTALFFKDRPYKPLAIFWGIFIAFTAFSFYLAKAPLFAFVGLGAAALQLLWQLWKLDIKQPKICLKLFMSNIYAGLFICLGLLLSAVFH